MKTEKQLVKELDIAVTNLFNFIALETGNINEAKRSVKDIVNRAIDKEKKYIKDELGYFI